MRHGRTWSGLGVLGGLLDSKMGWNDAFEAFIRMMDSQLDIAFSWIPVRTKNHGLEFDVGLAERENVR